MGGEECYIVDRKELIKVRASQVDTPKTEGTLLAMQGIDCVVIGVHDRRSTENCRKLV